MITIHYAWFSAGEYRHPTLSNRCVQVISSTINMPERPKGVLILFLLPLQKILNAKPVADALSIISKTPCTPASPPQTGFFLGGCIVSPKGIITLPDNCTSEDADSLCRQLFLEGFSYYPSEETPLLEAGNSIPVDHDSDNSFSDPRLARNNGKKYITISMDQGNISENDLKKLENLVTSKSSLLKKTLEADDLPIIVRNHKIYFPWFIDNGTEGEKQAYLDLINRLVYLPMGSR